MISRNVVDSELAEALDYRVLLRIKSTGNGVDTRCYRKSSDRNDVPWFDIALVGSQKCKTIRVEHRTESARSSRPQNFRP